MKKKLVAVISVVAVVIIIVAVVLRANHKSYINVIPASAVAVAYVDFPGIVEESGVDRAALDTVFGQNVRLQDVGIDFTKKAYAFVSREGIPALLFPVEDAGKLRAFLYTMQEAGRCSAPENFRGYEWATVSGSYLVGFNGEACLVMGPSLAAAQSELRQIMLSYFEQPKAERAVNEPMFERLKDQKGLVALTGKMEMVPSFYSMLHAAGLSFDAESGDFILTATLNSDKNKLCFHAEIESENKKMEQDVRDLLAMFGPIDGDFLDVIPQNAFAWFGAHVEGDKLIRELRKNNTFLLFLMMANQIVDVESLVKNISGDCACFSMGEDNQAVVFAAKVRDRQILSAAPSWVERSSPDIRMKWEQGIFSVKSATFEAGLGMLDEEHMFAVSGKPGCFTIDQSQWKSALLNPYKDEVRGCLFYLWLDVERAWNANRESAEVLGSLIPFVQEHGLGGMEMITVRMEDVNELDLTFIFKQGSSPLKQIMGY